MPHPVIWYGGIEDSRKLVASIFRVESKNHSIPPKCSLSLFLTNFLISFTFPTNILHAYIVSSVRGIRQTPNPF
jgi:hypothetical protein